MTTADSRQPGDRFSLLYRLSQTFNSSLDLDEVLNTVMDEIIAVTGAERGFVMLREPDGSLAFRAARGIERETIDDSQFQISRSVVEWAAQEGEPILTSDAQRDERFSSRTSVVDLRLRSILCVPLRVKDQLLGVVYVDNRLLSGIFTEDDLELLSAIASSAAIAIDNARLYLVAVDQGRMEKELQTAYEIQSGLLPQETPRIAGWEFAACWHPAREVAGDYYDFGPVGDGQLGLLIADVSDKGTPAALFMATTRSIVRASVKHASSPAEGIDHANRLICADSVGGMFVTLFYAQLEPETGELTYVNAGHNPPWLFNAGKDEPTELTRTGMALGVMEDVPFEQKSIQLQAGDLILLYTDGVTEATDADDAEYGMERLLQTILDNRDRPASDILAAIEQGIDSFVGSAPQFDDITMMVVKRV